MNRRTRYVLPPLLLALSLAVLAGGAFAASPHRSGLGHAPRMSSMTIDITTTSGTVWGTVTARYLNGHHTMRSTCSAASCTLRIPQGAMVHLSQAARDTATWPFKDWQVVAHQRTRSMGAKTIALKATGGMSVTAVYVLTQSQSSSSGSGGSYWP